MNTNDAAEASRGDAVNVLSFLVVVSLCLALAAYTVLRVTHTDPRGLLAHLDGRVVVPASARGPVSAPPPALAAATAAAQPVLELPPEASPAEVVSHGDRSRPLVALTFDADMTPAMVQDLQSGRVKRFVNDGVVAALHDLDVPATFFLSGLWIERYPDTARAIAADPNFEVASQGYSQQAFRADCLSLPTIDLARATDDLERSQTVIEGISSRPVPFFRFPGGCYDAASLAAIRPANLQVVEYDVVSGDAFATDPARIVGQTVPAVQNGSIVVLHLTGGNTAPVTDRALPGIVRQLRARGFQLVRVSDLLLRR